MQDISDELDDDRAGLEDRQDSRPHEDVGENQRQEEALHDPEDEDVRLDVEKQETVALRYFIGGCFFLPFLWLTSYFFFRDLLDNEEIITPKTRFYVRTGMTLFWVVVFAFAAWFLIFLIWRVDMGSVGDALLIAFPKGRV